MHRMIRPPSDGPGERRLERPPSERYAAPDSAPEAAAGAGSTVRAMGLGLLAIIGGALGFVLLGGIALVTAGLLAWAAIVGWIAAMAIRLGARAARARRVAPAVILALLAVGLGQVGIWVYAQAQGGVLPLVEHLATVFGMLVPLEFVVAGVVAWWTAR